MSAGKGDSPRPAQVDRETVEANWARTFGKAKPDGSYGVPFLSTWENHVREQRARSYEQDYPLPNRAP